MFNDVCTAGDQLKKFPYGVFTMLAMMLYYLLLIDLAVFNTYLHLIFAKLMGVAAAIYVDAVAVVDVMSGL